MVLRKHFDWTMISPTIQENIIHIVDGDPLVPSMTTTMGAQL